MKRAFGSILVLAAALVALALPAHAQGGAASDATPVIDFPNSGAAAAQPDFLRGMVALHNFAFHAAVVDFRKAEKIDPKFALAYWGEAMSHAQFVWGNEDVEAGRRVLSAERAAVDEQAITPRERGYLDAARALFGPGYRVSREGAFENKMRALHERYPDDFEAAVFYALALVRRGPQLGPAPVAKRLQAAAVLKPLYERNPRHPGVLHYLIHAYDDPVHARLALPYARAYERIAMRSPHALHMPSHIYVRLGLWDGVARANENAYVASLEPQNAADGPDLHSLEWLHFARLQQGRLKDAARLLLTMQKYANKGSALPVLPMCPPDAGDSKDPAVRAATRMNVRTIVAGRAWNQARMPQGKSYLDLFLSYPNAVFVAGIGAAERGDFIAANRAVQEIASLRQPAVNAKLPTWAQRMDAMSEALNGVISWRSDKPDEASRHFENAVHASDALEQDLANADQSLPDPVKPVRELYGEMLLNTGKTAAAIAEFSAVLRRYPRRPVAMLDLARALRASGDTKAAACRYAELAGIWHTADADLPALAEARRESLGAADCAKSDSP